MDGNLIIVEVCINRVLLKPVLISTCYKYYFIVYKDLVIDLQLPRVKIVLKPIISFVKENTKKPLVEIMEIIKFSIDFSVYKRNIFACVVLILLYLVIISLL